MPNANWKSERAPEKKGSAGVHHVFPTYKWVRVTVETGHNV